MTVATATASASHHHHHSTFLALDRRTSTASSSASLKMSKPSDALKLHQPKATRLSDSDNYNNFLTTWLNTSAQADNDMASDADGEQTSYFHRDSEDDGDMSDCSSNHSLVTLDEHEPQEATVSNLVNFFKADQIDSGRSFDSTRTNVTFSPVIPSHRLPMTRPNRSMSGSSASFLPAPLATLSVLEEDDDQAEPEPPVIHHTNASHEETTHGGDVVMADEGHGANVLLTCPDPDCGKVYPREQALRYRSHVRNHRKTKKTFQCPRCPLNFTRNFDLLRHSRIHTGDAPYRCHHEGCSRSFRRSDALKRHLAQHI